MGRAEGGLADTIRRRMIHSDEILDDRLEPALDALRRAKLRRLTGAAWSHSSLRTRISKILGNLLGVPRGEIERALLRPSAGAAWAALEAKTSALIR
jgi:hypothetical protein